MSDLNYHLLVCTKGRSNPSKIVVKNDAYSEGKPYMVIHINCTVQDNYIRTAEQYNAIAVFHVKYFGNAKRHNK